MLCFLWPVTLLSGLPRSSTGRTASLQRLHLSWELNNEWASCVKSRYGAGKGFLGKGKSQRKGSETCQRMERSPGSIVGNEIWRGETCTNTWLMQLMIHWHGFGTIIVEENFGARSWGMLWVLHEDKGVKRKCILGRKRRMTKGSAMNVKSGDLLLVIGFAWSKRFLIWVTC